MIVTLEVKVMISESRLRRFKMAASTPGVGSTAKATPKKKTATSKDHYQ